ncbi:MAG: serine/threonine transporter SstT [bacterium]|nr:serine/threonine transporter SstT [bacterium]
MKDILRQLWEKWNQLSLVKQIICGIVLGLVLALSVPKLTFISLFGTLFVGALKSVAPLLVFFLVMDSLAQHKSSTPTNIKSIIILYCVSMLLAALAAVFITMTFAPTLVLQGVGESSPAPSNIGEVLHSVFTSFVQNPVEAISKANYIGILFWAVIFGVILRPARESTKTVLHDTAEAVSKVIGFVIRFAPLGVMGLLYKAISDGGLSSLLVYGKLILVLVGIMLFTALILNPLIVFFTISGNPYPLVWKCLRDSGVTAFFTRSSAANIPVNMAICEELKLDRATYSVSIPLGATINMCGAAITITTMTLATVNTLHIHIDIISAILMCIMATISACGSSGVAGGSLLLIPLACGMFGISDEIAMQVVGTGFIIGVIQDSCETALNSSSDLLFTAAADIRRQKQSQ